MKDKKRGLRLFGLAAALVLGIMAGLGAAEDTWYVRVSGGLEVLWIPALFGAWVAATLAIGVTSSRRV